MTAARTYPLLRREPFAYRHDSVLELATWDIYGVTAEELAQRALRRRVREQTRRRYRARGRRPKP